MTYYNLTEPLTDKARKDLCASIVNWSYRINNDVSGCPLCRVYHLNYKICRNIDLACDGCPVKMVTKKSFCKGTPYDMGYFDAIKMDLPPGLLYIGECRSCVKATGGVK